MLPALSLRRSEEVQRQVHETPDILGGRTTLSISLGNRRTWQRPLLICIPSSLIDPAAPGYLRAMKHSTRRRNFIPWPWYGLATSMRCLSDQLPLLPSSALTGSRIQRHLRPNSSCFSDVAMSRSQSVAGCSTVKASTGGGGVRASGNVVRVVRQRGRKARLEHYLSCAWNYGEPS